MKKETLLEIILGTIGGIIFAIGISMCLIPKWNLLIEGCIVSIIGFIILLGIIPIYRSKHPKKVRIKSINLKKTLAWIIGIITVLVMGYGMSRIMIDDPNQNDMIFGMTFSILGLIVCILDYPIYSYLNKKD